MFLPHKILEEKLLRILAEDLGQGDITTSIIVPEESVTEAKVIAKDSGVVCGIEEATILSESLGLKTQALVRDGQKIGSLQVLLKISGKTRTILSAERTLLNLISRMSGIATVTRKLVEEIRKNRLETKVACTRKTAPGLLYFDKKAVLVGGGDTHRLHLDNMVLIKDNHIKIAGNLKKAIEVAKSNVSFSQRIEVEITEVEDVIDAAKAGVDIIMFDNFSLKKIEKAIRLLKKMHLREKVLLEASGGITKENFLQYASTGVDIISLGEITHSAKALDISLEITK
jgi:nicotinate-nucleotide pyrophosphorylase (carboxylating)